MKLNKSYKIRLYPNDEQIQFFEQNFGNVRFIYNKMLGDKINHYKKTKEQKESSAPPRRWTGARRAGGHSGQSPCPGGCFPDRPRQNDSP